MTLSTCVYFDNAATTYPKPEEVYAAMDDANRHFAVNAGRGSYALAQKAASVIADTKEAILKLVKAQGVAEVVLTASATVASNQIFGGLHWSERDVVYVTPYEHNAVMRVLYGLQEKYHFSIEMLEASAGDFTLDLDKIKYQFSRKKPTVVAMTHVSNVIGYRVPVEQVASAAKTYGATVVVDGAQALGLIPFRWEKLNADFYIFAGHKTLYGPFGVGGFLKNPAHRLNAFLAGGTGSDSLNLSMTTNDVVNYEPGSPNIVAINGLYAALQTLHPQELSLREQHLTELLVRKLREIAGVTLYVPGRQQEHIGIVAFNVDGYQASDVGMILDEDYKIAVRTGYQCAPYVHDLIEDREYLGVVRASVGRYTTEEEVELLAGAVREIAEG